MPAGEIRNLIRLTKSTPDVWPIMTIVGGALCVMVYKGFQHFNSPDVLLSRSRRSAVVVDPHKYDEKIGDEWADRIAKQYRHKDHHINKLNAFDFFRPSFWSDWSAAAQAPEKNTIYGVSGAASHYHSAPVDAILKADAPVAVTKE